MHVNRTFVAAAAVVALSAVPASAQHRGGGGAARGGGGSRGGAQVGAARSGVGRPMAGPVGPGAGRSVAVPRGSMPGPYSRGAYGLRGGYAYGGYGNRGYGYGYRGSYGYAGGYGFGGGYGYRGFGYGLRAPYYAFRPRVSLGFGLFVGYPVTYPYWAFPDPYIYGYPYSYPYAYPYSYPYSSPYPYVTDGPTPNANPQQYGTPAPSGDPGTVTAAPGAEARVQGQASTQGQYGGLSFQITPSNGGIYVDNVYVGIVSQFSATTQPLTLAPGRHHIEVRLSGYESMTFDVNVAPGQVIPYEGTMERR